MVPAHAMEVWNMEEHIWGAVRDLCAVRGLAVAMAATCRYTPRILGPKQLACSCCSSDAQADTSQTCWINYSVLEMEVEKIKKGCYDHYMQKEIHEQPHSLTATMRGRLKDGGVLLGGLKEHLKTIRRRRKVVFIGCGTSYNVALAARPFVEEPTGIPVTMEVASDLMDRQGPIYRE